MDELTGELYQMKGILSDMPAEYQEQVKGYKAKFAALLAEGKDTAYVAGLLVFGEATAKHKQTLAAGLCPFQTEETAANN